MSELHNNQAVIGVDFGGTSISVGKVVDGKIIKEEKRLVPAQVKDKNIIIDIIIDVLSKVFDDSVVGIGMGIPGAVDRKKGVIYDLQNIPSIKNEYLKNILEEEFEVPVFLDNDANCFALGEKEFGKGKGVDNFVGVTLGTGIGAGIINRGHLLDDLNCASGEFGMMPYLDATYEDYCSGAFFKKQYQLSGLEMFQRARIENKEAINSYKKYGYHLAQYVKAVIFALDPEKIIFGGSIIDAERFFEKTMFEEIEKLELSSLQKKTKIEFSEMRNSAILGASVLFFENHKNKIGELTI